MAKSLGCFGLLEDLKTSYGKRLAQVNCSEIDSGFIEASSDACITAFG